MKKNYKLSLGIPFSNNDKIFREEIKSLQDISFDLIKLSRNILKSFQSATMSMK
ncbi:hypothetical protein NIES25_42340 [Nostoc linckia NIES-25]|nr:hypothetical protein NIES25_42340 [Nostoc linckia NIES-25]